jgi:hypothetical protein
MDIKKQLNIAGEGAKLVAKQAERMKVANFSLPGAYRKLGEEVFKAGTLKDKLGEIFARIQLSIEEQEKLNQSGPAAEGFAEKMKVAAISAKNMAVSKKIDYDRGGLFSELGRLAYEGHKDVLGHGASIDAVAKEVEKLVSLDEEISNLISAGKGSFLNPKNVAFGLVAIVGFMLFYIGFKMFFGISNNGPLHSQEGPLVTTRATTQKKPELSSSPNLNDSSVDLEDKNLEGKVEERLVESQKTTKFPETAQYKGIQKYNKAKVPIVDNPVYDQGPNKEEIVGREYKLSDGVKTHYQMYKNKENKYVRHGQVAYFKEHEKEKGKNYLVRTGAYYDGKRHGFWVDLTTAGYVWATYQFDHGRPTGVTNGYDSDGKVIWSVSYGGDGVANTSNMSTACFVHQMRLLQDNFSFGRVSDNFLVLQAWGEIGPAHSDEPSESEIIGFYSGGLQSKSVDKKDLLMYLGRPKAIKITNMDKDYPSLIRTFQFKLTDGYAYVNIGNEAAIHNPKGYFLDNNGDFIVYGRCFISDTDFYKLK